MRAISEWFNWCMVTVGFMSFWTAKVFPDSGDLTLALLIVSQSILLGTLLFLNYGDSSPFAHLFKKDGEEE